MLTKLVSCIGTFGLFRRACLQEITVDVGLLCWLCRSYRKTWQDAKYGLPFPKPPHVWVVYIGSVNLSEPGLHRIMTDIFSGRGR